MGTADIFRHFSLFDMGFSLCESLSSGLKWMKLLQFMRLLRLLTSLY